MTKACDAYKLTGLVLHFTIYTPEHGQKVSLKTENNVGHFVWTVLGAFERWFVYFLTVTYFRLTSDILRHRSGTSRVHDNMICFTRKVSGHMKHQRQPRRWQLFPRWSIRAERLDATCLKLFSYLQSSQYQSLMVGGSEFIDSVNEHGWRIMVVSKQSKLNQCKFICFIYRIMSDPDSTPQTDGADA